MLRTSAPHRSVSSLLHFSSLEQIEDKEEVVSKEEDASIEVTLTPMFGVRVMGSSCLQEKSSG